MSLKSIRESYTNLLSAFAEAGVKLNESQKANLDMFIVALETKMSEQKKATVRATKKIVTEHLEREFKKSFESIIAHQAQNAELAAKVQRKIQSIKESKKIARKVNRYLDLYVESVLPKKTIVDYSRMQKLEALHESLKDMLVVDEDAIIAKKQELSSNFSKAKRHYETQIAKLQAKLNESMRQSQRLASKIDTFKAAELLESKTKDLPTFEARKMKKRFAGATPIEIEKNFSKVLESVQNETNVNEKEAEVTLEDEINDIIKQDDSDVEKSGCTNKNDVEERGEATEKKRNECSDDGKQFETMESIKFDKDGEVILESEDVIDADYMKYICSMAARID